MPKVTARCWALFDGQTRALISSKNDEEVREIASLTKIMTCLICLQLIENLNLDPYSYSISVSNFAASMIGTSAGLRGGDKLTIWDLLHGMMLPSGNDAAYVIAEHFGHTLFYRSDEYRDQLQAKENMNETDIDQIKCKNPVRFFIREMNRFARELGLADTVFANSHGLSHKYNRSNARDLGMLCCEAMNKELFRKIVNCKEYKCSIINSFNGGGQRSGCDLGKHK